MAGIVQRSLPTGLCIAFCFLIAGQLGRAGELPRVKLQTLDGAGTLTSFAFSPDGKMVAGAIDSTGAGTEGGNLVLWDTKTGRIRKALPYEKGWRWLAFSGDGATLATYGYSAANDQERANGVITIWAIRAAKVRATMFIKGEIASSRGRGLHQRTLQLSPDGKRLVGAIGRITTPPSGRGWVMTTTDLVAWDTKTCKEVWRLNDVGVRLVALSPDASTVGIYAADLVNRQSAEDGSQPASFANHRLLLIDAATGKTLKTHALEQDAIEMRLLMFAPGGRHWACLDDDGLKLRNIDTGKAETEIRWDERRRDTESFAIAADETTLLREGICLYPGGNGVTSAPDGIPKGRYLERMEISSGTLSALQTFATPEDAFFTSTFLSPDLKHLAGRTRSNPHQPVIFDVSHLNAPAPAK